MREKGGSSDVWASCPGLPVKLSTATPLTSHGCHLPYSSSQGQTQPASFPDFCFYKVILRWSTEKCPLNDCTAPRKWLSWRRDDSWGSRLRKQVHSCSPVLSSYIPKQHMSSTLSSPSGRKRGGVPALLRVGTVPALMKLSLLASLRKEPWLSPVALSRWEVLNKSQQTPHKPWLLIYMFDTNWMCKSIRKLTSWDFQAFIE